MKYLLQFLVVPVLILVLFVPLYGGPSEHVDNDAALVDFYQGRFAEAAIGFRKAIEKNPEYADAHCNLGRALLKLGSYKEAIVSFETALNLKPDYTMARQNLKNAQKKMETKEKKESAMGQNLGIAISPELSFPWQDFSPAFYAYFENRFDEAKSLFNKMQRDDPYSLRPFVEKGIIYYELKMYGEAVQNFKDALRLDSDNVHALYNLGLAYEMNNQRDKALESYSLARQKNGSFTKAFERFSALEGNLADEYLISARRAYEKEEWQRCLEIVEKSMALTLPGTQKYKELKKMKTLATTRVSVGKNRQKSIRNAFSAERKKYDEVVVRGQLRYRDIDLIWTGVVFKKFEEKGETILQVMYATDSTTLVNTTDRNCFAQMYQIHCGKILPKDRRIDEDSFVEVYGRVIGTESMIEGYRYGCTEQIPVVRAFRLTLTNQTTSGPLVIEPLN